MKDESFGMELMRLVAYALVAILVLGFVWLLVLVLIDLL